MKRILFLSLIIISLIIIFFSMALNASAEIAIDGIGHYHIDTYPQGAASHIQHLTVFRMYDPITGEESVFTPRQGGMPDSAECFANVFFYGWSEKVKEGSRDIIRQIAEATGNQYTVYLSISVCHVDWVVVYLHDGEQFVDRLVYDSVMVELESSR